MSSLHERLWAKIEVRSADDCWPFRGYLLKGYGRISLGGRSAGTAYAHRVVLEETSGPAPSGHSARHLCGNRACCNPAHLAWGDQSANERDKLSHGRDNRGKNHGMAKLDEWEVREIRERAAGGELQRDIARAFRIRQQHVSEIVRRKVWAWLD